MKISPITGLLLAAAMVSGCAGAPPAAPPGRNADLFAPDPILATDQVRDARAAIRLAVARCFSREREGSFQAELRRDQWFVWADFKGGSFSAEVDKRDGAVTDCQDIAPQSARQDTGQDFPVTFPSPRKPKPAP